MKISNKLGLTFEFLENGSLKNIEAEKIRLNLKPGTVFSKEIGNIYLRKRASTIEYHPLLGKGSNSTFVVINNQFIVKGNWNNLTYTCTLQLAENSYAWKWTIEIANNDLQAFELDLVYFQEVGLKTANDGLVNEYYVSQYLERIVLQDATHGAVVACRQNIKEATGYPWLLLASAQKANSALTDGMQFYGNSHRATEVPQALIENTFEGNFAGESPIVALQEEPFSLAPQRKKQVEFIGIFVANHTTATSVEDLALLKDINSAFTATTESFNDEKANAVSENIFNTSAFLPVADLNETEVNQYFSAAIHHKEEKDGKWLSFFTNDQHHVISKQKEILVDRPHAHILQAKIGYNPDENVMSTTCFATGVFNSHISQGNTNFNVFLSVNTSQFNTILESGQRIFVKIEDQFYLLGIPSAFEIGLDFCRWIYKYDKGVFEIVTKSSIENPVIETTFKVLEGNPVSLIITHDFDKLNTWKMSVTDNTHVFVGKPADHSMIKEKFADAAFRIEVKDNASFTSSLSNKVSSELQGLGQELFVIESEKTSEFTICFVGEVLQKFDDQNQASKNGQQYWAELGNALKLESSNNHIQAINSILPWYGMNAMTHYLTPYGLEQFSGAAWGTRDVSQGPIEFLLSLEKYEAAREVLKTIFRNQNTIGDWPQWWMFDSYSHVRAGDCHGDIYYWVIISLANYIKVTGDFAVLEERVPYFGETAETTIAEHTERLIKMIVDSYIPGTALVPFGGGDWNDSLQPLSEELAKRLTSSWTVEMNYQAFAEIKEIYEMLDNTAKAEELEGYLTRIKSDFNQYLIKDGIVAGYGYVEDNGDISVLLHPTDNKTGIKYSLLPMDRGIISGIFTKEQALSHQTIIDQYLKGPDGARLMDKPLKYKGGIQEIFQRAESSTYFGREIGLMYIHEHIRYAESQAVLGKADEFVKAMRQAIPVNYQEVVPQGSLRQANCYYSSSDVAFKTRYEADEKYQDVLEGKMQVDGGWRVYSSGPGIYISLVIKKLMGFRADKDFVVIDPVLTKEMNGLQASMSYKGHTLDFEFKVQQNNFGPKSISVNGNALTFGTEENPYRQGGAKMPKEEFSKYLKEGNNIILVEL